MFTSICSWIHTGEQPEFRMTWDRLIVALNKIKDLSFHNNMTPILK